MNCCPCRADDTPIIHALVHLAKAYDTEQMAYDEHICQALQRLQACMAEALLPTHVVSGDQPSSTYTGKKRAAAGPGDIAACRMSCIGHRRHTVSSLDRTGLGGGAAGAVRAAGHGCIGPGDRPDVTRAAGALCHRMASDSSDNAWPLLALT